MQIRNQEPFHQLALEVSNTGSFKMLMIGVQIAQWLWATAHVTYSLMSPVWIQLVALLHATLLSPVIPLSPVIRQKCIKITTHKKCFLDDAYLGFCVPNSISEPKAYLQYVFQIVWNTPAVFIGILWDSCSQSQQDFLSDKSSLPVLCAFSPFSTSVTQ